LTIGWFLAES